ncbi:MAG: 16S rRNA (cytosine(1402)-N(4))-methyltransferase RsmH [Chloroflexi bacterium]|nr:MAG: 16S rRNA (cytosine(1402)-N(4))-methyltransferase RsmH [Chloroflexota bacterium]
MPSSRGSRRTSNATFGTSGSRDVREGKLHEPVLLAEVLAQLDPREDGRYLDGTVGAGGHAAAILERSAPTGRVLGLDVDPKALGAAASELARFGDRAVLVRANYAVCDVVAREHDFVPLDGVLLDLGLSSIQLADEDRGFSFRSPGPLDMRADPDLRETAADIVNSWAEKDLRRVFAEYGEEPEAARVAGAIVRRRVKAPFEAGGRLLVISFHSLEDRAVKQFFARESRDCICPPHLPTCVCGHRAGLRVVTRRPLRADSAEVARNPRARSAAFRVAEKLP